MADDTNAVVAFVQDRHPELDIDTIMKCVAAISDWVDLEMDHGDGN